MNRTRRRRGASYPVRGVAGGPPAVAGAGALAYRSAVLVLALLGCASPVAEPARLPASPPGVAAAALPKELPAACADAPLVTWEGWGQGFFLTWCTSCHSAYTADRRDAPEGVDFDTIPDVERWRERILARVVDEGTMPVGGGVYPDQIELLKVLLTCGP